MIRSARSTSRRRSPTAPTTSWWADRSATPPTRAPPRRRCRPRSPRSSSHKLLEQALEVRVVRQHHALEQGLASAAHEDGRKVLDLDVLDRLGFILDVHPAELGARKAARHLEEPRLIGLAGVAPGGAQAGDEKFAIRLHAWPILCMRSPEWQASSRSPGRSAKTAAACHGARWRRV